MFTSQSSILPWLLIASAFAVNGCGKTDSSITTGEVDDTDLMSELLGDIDLTDGRPADPAITQVSQSKPSEQAFAMDDSTPSIAQPAAGALSSGQSLELRLSAGDRFQLVKSVRQNLTQKSDQFPAKAETQLELHIQIAVEQVQPQASLLSIQYNRIRYQHDINGQRMSFDSETQGGNAPAELAPYAGMIGNGFRFWLGKDNVIRETVGYQEFLQRCVQSIPADRQASVLNSIAAKFGNDGVANFVDDSIGLLPYNQSAGVASATVVSVGDVWTKQRRLMQPTPVEMQSTCRLDNMTDRTATITTTGTITAVAGSQGSNAVQITGGRSMGSCVVDRTTGLPMELSRSTFLSMQVATASGQTVQQDKNIETTIRTFPASGGLVVSGQGQRPGLQPTPQPSYQTPRTQQFQNQGHQQNRIQQTSGTTQQPLNAPLRGVSPQPQGIDTSNLSSTATAVYPD